MAVYPVAAVRNKNFGVPATFPLLDDLVAYWDLSEASGQRNDSHINGLHLTDNNTVGNAVGPDGGTAANFVAANSEYLTRADNAFLSLGADVDFTWAIWFWSSSTSQYNTLVQKGLASHDAASLEYAIRCGSYDGGFSGNAPNFAVGNGVTGTNIGSSSAANKMNVSAWMLLTAWHDKTADTINFQTNQNTVVTAAWSGGTQDRTDTFYMGLGPGNWQYWNGRMAYAGFWKRVLTANERTWLYNSGAGRSYAAVAAYTG